MFCPFAIGVLLSDRLGQFSRGTLNGTKDGLTGSASRSQDWDLDALGNWNSVTDETSTTQTRTHDAQNRITSVSGATSPTYSANGEMTGDETGQALAYDAWGRLVSAGTSDYAYDALARRVGENDQALYYSRQWQVLEERDASTGEASDQYVWSPVYVDAMVLRDQNVDGQPVEAFGGGDGVVTGDFGGNEAATATALTSSGQILVAGTKDGDFLLARYNDDGTLDTSFGASGGYTAFDLGGTETVGELAVLSDGKILLAGGSGGDFAFARFNADGTVDTTFGSSGKIIADFGGGESVAGFAVQSDGKIIAAGSMSGDWLVARFTAAGALDTGFGTGGYVTTDFNGMTDKLYSVALQSNGKIVAVGSALEPEYYDEGYAVARYNTDGSLDTSFGTGGKVRLGGVFSRYLDVAVQTDGKIVAAGTSWGISSIHRFNVDGTMDTGFGSSGSVFDPAFSDAQTVVIEGDGKIAFASKSSSGTSAIVRLESDGTYDQSFGDGGVAITEIGGSSYATRDIILMPDGSILTVGRIGNGTDSDLALVRLHGNGNRLYALHDANFNVTAVTDASGNVVERYIYDPYGERTVLNADWTIDTDGLSDVVWLYGHQGGRHDLGVGLVSFRYRDLDTSLGRWTREDPWHYVSGMNLHLYNLANPANNLDPTGENPLVIIGGVVVLPALVCAAPYAIYADNQNAWANRDKMKHCWVSCMIQRQCGSAMATLAGTGREVLQLIIGQLGTWDPILGPNPSATADMVMDAIQDEKANMAGRDCAGPGSDIPVCGMITRWFLPSCNDCCEGKAAASGDPGW